MATAIWKACGSVAIPLLLLSVAVLTVAFDRAAFWWRWWRGACLAAQQTPEPERRGEILRSRMASGEAVLQAAALLAPLLGLLGTVSGLMEVLRALGPQLMLPANAPLLGYADVLLSTLFGLQITVLATVLLLINRFLRRWQLRWLREASSEAGRP